MLAYIVRRLLLIIPTLFGIMVINFAIIQAAPGGPVEQMIQKIRGTGVSATDRISGGSSENLSARTESTQSASGASSQIYRGAQGIDLGTTQAFGFLIVHHRERAMPSIPRRAAPLGGGEPPRRAQPRGAQSEQRWGIAAGHGIPMPGLGHTRPMPGAD